MTENSAASKPISHTQAELDLNLLTRVDSARVALGRRVERSHRKLLEQFLTPAPAAALMASLFQDLDHAEITLLDPGAGIGSLTAAFVERVCRLPKQPEKIHTVAYEIDSNLLAGLEHALKLCSHVCQANNIQFTYEIRHRDFIEDAATAISAGAANPTVYNFTHAILNPPYSKINSGSQARQNLRKIGLETTNLYAGFMAATALLLQTGGEMVSITPRSFCNGAYFRPFRKLFLTHMHLSQMHMFESRKSPFREDAVLQEILILHSVRLSSKNDTVRITTSAGPESSITFSHSLPSSEVIRPSDKEQFIRILPNPYSQQISRQMERFTCSLQDLSIAVSTGRVVDFRAKEFLRLAPCSQSVPLVYPINFVGSSIKHPVRGKKPQALIETQTTQALLLPDGTYVLCKRFSAKEEKRRIAAAVYHGGQSGYSKVGFENHLNYFHQNGHGLDLDLAQGLCIFLNSSLVDAFFRLFNGHTQVNVGDLRSLGYPSQAALVHLSKKAGSQNLTQQQIDTLIEQELLNLPGA